MKLKALHLFLILLGSLVFCSFLGGICQEGFKTDLPSTQSLESTISGKGNQDAQHATSTYVAPAGDVVTVTPGDHKTTAGSPPPMSSNAIQPPQASVAADSYGQQVTDYDPSNVYQSGISGNQIAPGSEDLYILKSEIVPPVCPVCPTISACPRQEPCPACPPCARCPEPAFECKKVPNYSTNDDRYLPRPVLADFSQFGM